MMEWMDVHERVRAQRKAQAELDHAGLALLREVIVVKVWEQLSYSNVIEYLDHELGYSPRVAYERLRVAHAIVALPKLEAALKTGERSFSAVRELSRVATPGTEGKWLEWSDGKTVRDIERGVFGREKGMLPDDPLDHENLLEKLHFDVSCATAALVRQARQTMSKERGDVPEDDEFVAGLAMAYLNGGREGDGPAHQIAITTCASCQKGWQEGAGVQFPITATAVERAKSDALVIGAIDGVLPQRAKHVVRKSVRRQVLARDGHCCRVPGCIASTNLEIAHVDGIAATGKIDNRPENLLAICDGHHVAQHDGRLRLRKEGGRVVVERIAHPAPAPVKAAARDALMKMGYGPRQSWEVVGRVVSTMDFLHVGNGREVVDKVIDAALAALAPSHRAELAG